jgi:hypothetical protein
MPLSVKMFFIFVHRTVLKHLLMQPRYVCTLKMGYCSLSCGWMEVRINNADNINVYITDKSGYWNILPENMRLIPQSVFL